MEKQRSALTFVFITMLIDCIGIGIIVPVLPGLIKELTQENLSTASLYAGFLSFTYAIMQFIFAPILGGLSDSYGRRPVLLLSLLGLGIDYVFLSFAPSIAWLFIGRLISGVFGASFTTASAYIADISEPEKKAQNFGLIGVAFGLGFIIGPVIGGLVGTLGTRVPFMVAAVLSLVNCIYGFFVLPESLSPDHRRSFDWSRANPIGTLVQVKRYPAVMSLIMAFFLVNIASQSLPSVWSFYTMEKFGWNELWVGISLTFVGVLIALVQGGLIRIAIPKLGQARSVYLGLLLYVIGFFLFSIVTEGWMLFIVMIVYATGGISGPAIQGIMSNQIPANEQGELQGAVTAMISLTAIIGPLIMPFLFYYFTKDNPLTIYFPGMPYLVSSVLTLASAYLCYRSLKKHA